MVDIIRTKRNGCFKQFTNRAWGTYVAACEDPLANGEFIPTEFKVREDFPKLPAEIWTAIVNLYFHFAKANIGNLEAQVLLLRDEETLTKWKVVVPRQTVTGAHVDSNNFADCIDILTGERYTQFPPDGWVYGGSSHSHNSMALASFSGIDDKYELTSPGCHILVSTINLQENTYVITSSIVMKKTRFIVDNDSLIDSKSVAGVTYHPDVLDYIKRAPAHVWTGGTTLGKNWNDTSWVVGDPFFYNDKATTRPSNEDAEWAIIDAAINEMLDIGVPPKDIVKRIYKVDDDRWDTIYGGF